MVEEPRSVSLAAPRSAARARGVLSISFDLELAWGTRRSSKPDPGNAPQVSRDAVHGVLDILKRYEISATWATVGQLMRPFEDLKIGAFPAGIPAPRPDWFEGDWQSGIPAPEDPESRNYFAPDIIEALVTCSTYQELASHTFSHVVIGDRSCTPEIAESELRLVQELARSWGRTIHTLVFPRNQIGHLATVQQTGHHCYRGYNNEWYFRGPLHPKYSTQGVRKQIVRILKLIDEALAITPLVQQAVQRDGLWELPHSMFFPGRSGVARFLPASCYVRKATKGLNRAMATGGIFSLYSHEHNFCGDLPGSLAMFDEICCTAARLRDGGQLDILTMEEIAHELNQGGCPEPNESTSDRRVDGKLQRIKICTQPAVSTIRAAVCDSADVSPVEEAQTDGAA